ncbi:hypothetical protein BP5796_00720 [Coleophoma crateriformis]|uniref:Uncharacterized protein n=1 Tax=Coleophoma crateriformis TaxID=565419 RepID=A0A3D8T8W1_9HELO|nr:hypothetical protein BP5796_00720 [Coleophoma crateriformis]
MLYSTLLLQVSFFFPIRHFTSNTYLPPHPHPRHRAHQYQLRPEPSAKAYLPHLAPHLPTIPLSPPAIATEMLTFQASIQAEIHRRYQRVIRRIQILHYQYSVTMPLYVMTPGEKYAFNTMVAFLLLALGLLLFVFLPQMCLKAARMWMSLYMSDRQDGYGQLVVGSAKMMEGLVE